MRYEERMTKGFNETEGELSSLTSNSESEEDEEYQPTQTQPCTPTTSTSTDSTPGASSSKKKVKNIFQSPEVVGALDRVCLPDRGAVFVAGAVAQALGHDISEITLSRSSIRRSRIKERQRAAAMDEKEFSLAGPLLLHWDGKILPDIDGSKENVDRIAVIVTGNGQEKLLGIPKMDRGTGEAQVNACIEVIEKWNLRSQIKGLVFDTTASNTGLHKGACVGIEEALGTEMVWIACRHHVMEVVLSNVFKSLFGPTEGPSTALFQRFQKQWPSMNQDAYSTASDELFQDPILKNMRQEMLVYLPGALEKKHPRDDYQEFLRLSFWFLGGHKDKEKFRAPGPTHHARWMAKAIYALKIFLFKTLFKLTVRESQNITHLALFVSLVYVKQWNEAPLAIRAPLNDIEFLSNLKTYPNKTVASKAHEAFSRHLWFLSEHLVGIALLDDRVSASIKEKMVQNLLRPALADIPRRVKLTSESEQLKLEDLVTERTTSFFDVLMEEGKEKSQTFLKKPPGQWTSDPVFKKFYELAAHMTVVNDVAERGISLIEKYNDTLTKNEEQKQFILRLVQWLSIVTVLLSHLPVLIKKDQEEEGLQVLLPPLSRHIAQCDLEVLVHYAAILQKHPQQNIEGLSLLLHNSFGISLLCCLIKAGEDYFRNTSPVDIDNQFKTQWSQFIEEFVMSLESVPKEELAWPDTHQPQIGDHVDRFINNKLIGSVEDKLAHFSKPRPKTTIEKYDEGS
ncbi:hypothetical protein Bpfe_017019 [Biomphalaria pfeifferi]|uniref:Uncharacterized protein n=1 Tax=Biomphalaria pfeifferi TaxID=112525 RepID=A0AAD8BGZ1_BIOPF|nr:hypothetical protein Bpfe_017019 [Biomphalaria pfeifferi]